MRHVILIPLVFYGLWCFSQDDQDILHSSIYIEALGQSSVATINYEQGLLRKNKTTLYARIGIGPNLSGYSLDIPISIGGSYKEKRHEVFLTLGFLNMVSLSPYPEALEDRKKLRGKTNYSGVYREPVYSILNVSAEYRFYYSKRGFFGFVFSAYFFSSRAIFYAERKIDFIPWGGIKAGFKFK
ncbi:MAG: hypothetical protein JKY53_10635 [Flavobacteriales bacterium]|nr:hypothetical protein [Flavobacteriales bacterium]